MLYSSSDRYPIDYDTDNFEEEYSSVKDFSKINNCYNCSSVDCFECRSYNSI